MNSFYTNFSNESAGRLILKLSDGLRFNDGYTRIELLTPDNNLLARHEIGGELDFDGMAEVDLPINALKKKYKGLLRAIIHSTISGDKFILNLGFEDRGLEQLVILRNA